MAQWQKNTGSVLGFSVFSCAWDLCVSWHSSLPWCHSTEKGFLSTVYFGWPLALQYTSRLLAWLSCWRKDSTMGISPSLGRRVAGGELARGEAEQKTGVYPRQCSSWGLVRHGTSLLKLPLFFFPPCKWTVWRKNDLTHYSAFHEVRDRGGKFTRKSIRFLYFS